ncbi:unnamed protein product [Miscanthus lutarioriparius]|uniref:Phytocyanin domain-containing protein n=1 Tax=Miscanthus lutarioriparius TaxID=422564 RepID=A0A811P5Q1_9POAL|nr:unnamed protein product [Miscanthus lutarioriparius]
MQPEVHMSLSRHRFFSLIVNQNQRYNKREGEGHKGKAAARAQRTAALGKQSSRLPHEARAALASSPVLLLLLLLVGGCAGAVYKVGDLDAWGVPPPSKPDVYKRWAKSIHFALGDSIWFLYPPSQDSVLQLAPEAFASCDLSRPVARLADGNSFFNLTAPGRAYYASGAPGHCRKGQKLWVDVPMANGTYLQPSATDLAALAPPPPPTPRRAGDDTLIVWSCTKSRWTSKHQNNEEIMSLSWNESGKLLLCCTNKGYIAIIREHMGAYEVSIRMSIGKNQPVSCAMWTPGSDKFAVAAFNSIQMYGVKDGNEGVEIHEALHLLTPRKTRQVDLNPKKAAVSKETWQISTSSEQYTRKLRSFSQVLRTRLLERIHLASRNGLSCRGDLFREEHLFPLLFNHVEDVDMLTKIMGGFPQRPSGVKETSCGVVGLLARAQSQKPYKRKSQKPYKRKLQMYELCFSGVALS